MQIRSATVYFDNEDDARQAQASLLARGVRAELYTKSSDRTAPHNGGFMSRIRAFFGAMPAPVDYSRAALLTVANATPEAAWILREHGGRMNSTKDVCASA